MPSEELRFGIVGNSTKGNILEAIRIAAEYFRQRSIAFQVEFFLAEFVRRQGGNLHEEEVGRLDALVRECDMVIALGGDGTMLSISHATLDHDTPILGVNLGKLGFLAEVTIDDLIESLEMIRSGNYSVEQRLALTAICEQEDKPLAALNDVVVSKSGHARVIKANVWVDDEYLASFHADGIIVATPTGSTAYSLASGGPIVTPSSEVILISPISAHTLTARPVIVPDSALIKIEASAEEGEVLLMVDGQIGVTSEKRLEVSIKRAMHSVKLIKREGSSYFETLRNKLMWGKDSRFQEETTRKK